MASHTHHAHPAHDAHMTGPVWLPVVLALLLGAAALVAGLTTWRAATHSAHAQKAFTLSTQATNNANSLQQDASQAVNSERELFIAYEDAVAQHDKVLSDEVRGLIDPSTLRAITWWLAQPSGARPASPFAAANPQWTTPRRIIDARSALNDSTDLLTSADNQIHRSHELELFDAILAIALLTGGLTATLQSRPAQMILLGVSVAVLGVATIGLVVLW